MYRCYTLVALAAFLVSLVTTRVKAHIRTPFSQLGNAKSSGDVIKAKPSGDVIKAKPSDDFTGDVITLRGPLLKKGKKGKVEEVEVPCPAVDRRSSWWSSKHFNFELKVKYDTPSRGISCTADKVSALIHNKNKVAFVDDNSGVLVWTSGHPKGLSFKAPVFEWPDVEWGPLTVEVNGVFVEPKVAGTGKSKRLRKGDKNAQWILMTKPDRFVWDRHQ